MYPPPGVSSLCSLCRGPAVGTLRWVGVTNPQAEYIGRTHTLRLCAGHAGRMNLTSPKATWVADNAEVERNAG